MAVAYTITRADGSKENYSASGTRETYTSSRDQTLMPSAPAPVQDYSPRGGQGTPVQILSDNSLAPTQSITVTNNDKTLAGPQEKPPATGVTVEEAQQSDVYKQAVQADRLYLSRSLGIPEGAVTNDMLAGLGDYSYSKRAQKFLVEGSLENKTITGTTARASYETQLSTPANVGGAGGFYNLDENYMAQLTAAFSNKQSPVTADNKPLTSAFELNSKTIMDRVTGQPEKQFVQAPAPYNANMWYEKTTPSGSSFQVGSKGLSLTPIIQNGSAAEGVNAANIAAGYAAENRPLIMGNFVSGEKQYYYANQIRPLAYDLPKESTNINFESMVKEETQKLYPIINKVPLFLSAPVLETGLELAGFNNPIDLASVGRQFSLDTIKYGETNSPFPNAPRTTYNLSPISQIPLNITIPSNLEAFSDMSFKYQITALSGISDFPATMREIPAGFAGYGIAASKVITNPNAPEPLKYDFKVYSLYKGAEVGVQAGTIAIFALAPSIGASMGGAAGSFLQIAPKLAATGFALTAPRDVIRFGAPILAKGYIENFPLEFATTRTGLTTTYSYVGSRLSTEGFGAIDIGLRESPLAGITKTYATMDLIGKPQNTQYSLGMPEFTDKPMAYMFKGTADKVNVADVRSPIQTNIREKTILDFYGKDSLEFGRFKATREAINYLYATKNLPFEKRINAIKELDVVKSMPKAAQENLVNYFIENKQAIKYGSLNALMRGAIDRPVGDIDLMVTAKSDFILGATKALEKGGAKVTVIEGVVNVDVGGVPTKLLDVHDYASIGGGLEVGKGGYIGMGKVPEAIEVSPLDKTMYMSSKEQGARVGSSITEFRYEKNPYGENFFMGGSEANVKRVTDFSSIVKKTGSVYGNERYLLSGKAEGKVTIDLFPSVQPTKTSPSMFTPIAFVSPVAFSSKSAVASFSMPTASSSYFKPSPSFVSPSFSKSLTSPSPPSSPPSKSMPSSSISYSSISPPSFFSPSPPSSPPSKSMPSSSISYSSISPPSFFSPSPPSSPPSSPSKGSPSPPQSNPYNPPVGGIIPLGWLPSGEQQGSRYIGATQSKVKSKYQPSFTAQLLNITAKRSRGTALAELSGIGLRPILIGKKRGKK
jgi:hypothetical protein